MPSPSRSVRRISSRALARLGLALFCVSGAFPIAASILKLDPPLRWLGLLDLALAVALVLVAWRLVARMREAHTHTGALIEVAFRFYRAAGNVLLALTALYLLVGDALDWSVLLVGLAWRAGLLAYVLPAGIAAWRDTGQR